MGGVNGTIMSKTYVKLLKSWRKLHLFGSVGALLNWDERTKLPPEGSAHRAEQLSLLAGFAHDLLTELRIGEYLKELSEEDFDPASDAYVNVREMRRHYDRIVKVPKDLVEELVLARSRTYTAWLQARKQNSFAPFQAPFKHLIYLLREKAEALGWIESPYDPLLEDYEPGLTKKLLLSYFDPLIDQLTSMLRSIQIQTEASTPSPLSLRGESFPVVRQGMLYRDLAKQMGFSFRRGRFDQTIHPFATHLGPSDERVAVRIHPNSINALFGTMHEIGHALYDQGLDPDRYGSPMGEAASVGIHESQSRLWENWVGRSRPFWTFFAPRLKTIFPQSLNGMSPEDLYQAINLVQPSLIRVEADEVTYNLHVMMRFGLESALIEGSLQVADLPDAWQEKTRQLLGLTVPDVRRGCLQDIHWSQGSVGYFPTYTMGNLYAAQLWNKFKSDVSGAEAAIASGDFSSLRHWLKTNIYDQGSRHLPLDLVKTVTGKSLSVDPFLSYLSVKYGSLYHL